MKRLVCYLYQSTQLPAGARAAEESLKSVHFGFNWKKSGHFLQKRTNLEVSVLNVNFFLI